MNKKPNIILINCDDLGYGDLGCYGSKVNKTPVLDKMAQDGVRLTDFYTCSPVCSPSRGGMMTGCLPPRVSFGSFDGRMVLFPGMRIGLNPQEDTIASILKENGYITKLIGKWHCGDQPEFLPTEYGFDEYLGLPYSNDMGRQVVRETSPPLPLIDGKEIIEQQPDQCTLTDRYTEECVEFIERNANTPFFLYLAHMHVHRPLYAAPRFVEQSDNGDYGACVEAVDWSTGVIIDKLNELGLAEDTLVIFTSDNGGLARSGGSNAPLKGTKGTTWEGGQRVVCVMQWKGTIPAGTVADGIMSNIDFLPTFMAFAGINTQLKNKIDGVDCSDLILAKGESKRNVFPYYLKDALEAVRVGDWKLHLSKKEYNNDTPSASTTQLYNLRDDVGETKDVSAKNPAIVNEITRHYEKYRNELGDSFTNHIGKEIRDAGTVENPKPLTEYNENHPYIVALYDREDFG